MSYMPFISPSTAIGPAARLQGKLLMPNENIDQDQRVYQINKKYQEYLVDFGGIKRQQKQSPFEKLNSLIVGNQAGLKNLYNLRDDDLRSNKLLVDPSKTSPLLKALNDENQILREEIDKISMDLVNFTHIIDQLLNENTAIQQHLQNRDVEQRIFAESIEINKAETIQVIIYRIFKDYRFQLQQLQEENNLLVRHLEDIRLNSQEDYIRELQQELNNAKNLNEQTNHNFELAKVFNHIIFLQEREDILVRQLQILQPRYSQSIDQIFELEQKLEVLEDQLSKISNQNLLISNTTFRINLVLESDLEDLKRERINLIKERDDFKQICDQLYQRGKDFQSLESNLEDLKRERITLIKERDEFKQICDQLYLRGKDIKSQLELEKMRLQNLSGKDNDTINQVDILANDNSRLKLQISESQKQYEILQKEKNDELESQNLQSQRILENMKIRYTTSIQSLNDQNLQLEKQIKNIFIGSDVLQKEIEILQIENQDLKYKILDYQQLKRIIDGQSMELRQQKLDSQDQKLIISSKEEYIHNLQQDTQVTIQKLQREVQYLNKELESSQRQQ